MYKLLIGRKELNYDGELKAIKIFSFAENFVYRSSDLKNVVLKDVYRNIAYIIIRKLDKTYKCVKIDLEDAERLAKYNWSHMLVTGVDYIKTRNEDKSYTWLARMLTNTDINECQITHKNGDLFDYRKANLHIENELLKSIENIVMNPFAEGTKSGLSYIHIHKRRHSVEIAFNYKKGHVYMTENSKDYEDGIRGAIRTIVNRKYKFIKEHFGICLWKPEDCEEIINKFPTTYLL